MLLVAREGAADMALIHHDFAGRRRSHTCRACRCAACSAACTASAAAFCAAGLAGSAPGGSAASLFCKTLATAPFAGLTIALRRFFLAASAAADTAS